MKPQNFKHKAISHGRVYCLRNPAVGIGIAVAVLMLVATNVSAQEIVHHSDLHVFNCIVQPSEVVDVGSAVPGVVDHILVNRNDYITTDQTIAKLESSVESAAVDRLRARVNYTSSIKLREINARFSRQLRNDTESLMVDNMVARQEYQRLKTEAEIAQVQLKEAEDDRTLAYLELLQAEASMEQRTIRSPISGMVVEQYKSGGEYVDDKPLVRLANIDVLHIEILAPVELFGTIHLGMSATIKLQPEHFGIHEAKVALVDKIADAASGTFRVRLELDNAHHELPAGLRCTAQFNAESSTSHDDTDSANWPDYLFTEQDLLGM